MFLMLKALRTFREACEVQQRVSSFLITFLTDAHNELKKLNVYAR